MEPADGIGKRTPFFAPFILGAGRSSICDGSDCGGREEGCLRLKTAVSSLRDGDFTRHLVFCRHICVHASIFMLPAHWIPILATLTTQYLV
jgi:hypothetical protein